MVPHQRVESGGRTATYTHGNNTAEIIWTTIPAVIVVCLALVSQKVWSAVKDPAHFPGRGWIRPVYFAMLLSHTVLAAAIVPLVLVTLARGLRADFPRHARLARWTLPVWLYVSVTGVVIYVMLCRLSW